MKGRVLIVDDDAEVCALVGKVLMRAGHDVVTAQSGEAGLEVLAQGPVGCLVVDKLLPRLGGLELMAEARRRQPGIPVVLVTAHPEPFALGDERPDAVLCKPFKDLSTVEETVRAALEARASGKLAELRERVAAVVAEISPLRRNRRS
ncbi:MAG: response regulator [Myxococcota bacterium]